MPPYPDEISSRVLRLWPHKLHGEGHFAARLVKAGTPQPACEVLPTVSAKKSKKKQRDKAVDLTDYKEFEKKYLQTPLQDDPVFAHGRMELFGDSLYLLPAVAPSLAGLKLLRSGLQLGTLKKNRFEPAHALAKALKPSQACQSLSCSYEDANRYLHGETIACDPSFKGWVLVTVDNCTLGWGKAQNGMLKNHYPKGLRIMG